MDPYLDGADRKKAHKCKKKKKKKKKPHDKRKTPHLKMLFLYLYTICKGKKKFFLAKKKRVQSYAPQEGPKYRGQ